MFQKVLELLAAHEKGLLENDARVAQSIERKVAEGTGGGQETIHQFMGEQLGSNTADSSLKGNSYFDVVEVGNNEIANLLGLDDISLHDKISFISPFGVSIIIAYLT